MTAIAFLAALLTTGRLPIMILMSSLLCVQLMITGRHSFWAAVKFARIPILIFALLWFGLIFLNKDTSVFEVGGVGELLLLFFVGYIVGPTAALDFFLQHPNNYPDAPNHTFKFFLQIASQFHLINYVAAPIEAHIFVPFPTNVYTVYRTYISDYSLYGALAVMAVIGLLHTMLYRKARTGSRLGIYLFAVTFYEVLMVIFSDEYASFGAYIDMILFASIYILLRSLPLRILPRLDSGYGVRA
jgi:oligosaccharide repeat unit polymerase